MTDANCVAASAARDFVGNLAAVWADRLVTDLIGVYLLGSLAHGGFSARYSDIDVLLLTQAGLDAATLEVLRDDAMRRSSELAPKLSFFWTDRTFSLGRFPRLDRADFLDRAVRLIERQRIAPPRPSLAEIRAYLCDTPFANWARSAERFAASAALDPKDRKPYLRALLYPARFVYSFMTGRMASNDDAVAYLVGQTPPGLDVDLVTRALVCRTAGADPDSLFPARTLLPRQVAACMQFVDDSAAEGPAP